MAQFLFDVQEKNRLSQKGLLRRFSITCYGKQKTLEDIRTEKSKQFKKVLSKIVGVILGLLKVDGKVIDCKAVHPLNAPANVPIV